MNRITKSWLVIADILVFLVLTKTLEDLRDIWNVDYLEWKGPLSSCQICARR